MLSHHQHISQKGLLVSLVGIPVYGDRGYVVVQKLLFISMRWAFLYHHNYRNAGESTPKVVEF